jgi:ubiquitin-like 1-activating enzyme E1 B
LAFSGCRDIELIDLDTIDVSNLNRQFLFRPEHVGQPKAIVAGKAAEAFNPDIKVTSYHDNIKNPRFSVSYMAKFNVVLNALDNIDARRHVNRLCLAANVPLIDSGTTGYLGQVMPIIKGKTACYECFPKPTQKVYPICTIRSTPDKPVHCIVWAKECFKLLFGKASESMLFEDPSSGESSTYMHLIAFPSTEVSETTSNQTDALLSFGHALLTALYDTEIQKRIGMDVYKTAKVLPVLLSANLITEAVATTRSVLNKTTPAPSQVSGWDQRVPSLSDCIVEVLLSLHLASSDAQLGLLAFDKDALWTMKFVTAAANLRAHIFTIPLLSFHDAKGIAGNIIPAIATTNAIVAGVQVMQALRLISRGGTTNLDDEQTSSSGCATASVESMCPHTYCLRLPTRKGYFLQPSTAESPVAGCFVCGTAQLTLQVKFISMFLFIDIF